MAVGEVDPALLAPTSVATNAGSQRRRRVFMALGAAAIAAMVVAVVALGNDSTSLSSQTEMESVSSSVEDGDDNVLNTEELWVKHPGTYYNVFDTEGNKKPENQARHWSRTKVRKELYKVIGATGGLAEAMNHVRKLGRQGRSRLGKLESKVDDGFQKFQASAKANSRIVGKQGKSIRTLTNDNHQIQGRVAGNAARIKAVSDTLGKRIKMEDARNEQAQKAIKERFARQMKSLGDSEARMRSANAATSSGLAAEGQRARAAEGRISKSVEGVQSNLKSAQDRIGKVIKQERSSMNSITRKIRSEAGAQSTRIAALKKRSEDRDKALQQQFSKVDGDVGKLTGTVNNLGKFAHITSAALDKERSSREGAIKKVYSDLNNAKGQMRQDIGKLTAADAAQKTNAKNQFDSMRGRVSALSRKLGNSNGRIDTVGKRVENAMSSIKQVQKSMNVADKSIKKTISNNAAASAAQAAALGKRISAVSKSSIQRIGSETSRAEAAEKKLSEANSGLSKSLSGQVSRIDKDIMSAKKSASTASGRLSGRISNLSGRLGNIAKQAGASQKAISNRISSVSNRISAANKRIAALHKYGQATRSNLNNERKTRSAAIARLTGSVSSIRKQMQKSNSKVVATAAARAKAATQRAARISRRVSSLSKRVSGVNSRVNNTNQRVSAAFKKISRNSAAASKAAKEINGRIRALDTRESSSSARLSKAINGVNSASSARTAAETARARRVEGNLAKGQAALGKRITNSNSRMNAAFSAEKKRAQADSRAIRSNAAKTRARISRLQKSTSTSDQVLGKRVNAVNKRASNLRKDLRNLQKISSATRAHLSAEKRARAAAAARLSKSVSVLRNQMNTANAKMTAAAKSQTISSAKRATKMNNRISGVSSRVTGVNKRVSAVNRRVSSAITSIKASNTARSRADASINARISKVASEAQARDARIVRQMKNDFAASRKQDNTLLGRINSLAKKLSTDMVNMGKRITGTDTRVKTNANAINAVRGAQRAQSSRISAVSSAASKLNRRVSNLKLRRGPRGPPGKQGPRGAPGRRGVAGRNGRHGKTIVRNFHRTIVKHKTVVKHRTVIKHRRTTIVKHIHAKRIVRPKNRARSILLARRIFIDRKNAKVIRNVPRSKQYAYTFWMKPTQGPTGRWRSIFQRGSGLWDRRPGLWLYPRSMRLHVRTSRKGSKNFGCDPKMILPVGQWSHVTVSVGKGRLFVWLGKRLACSTRMPTHLLQAPSGPFAFGYHRYSPARAFLENVRFYPHALNHSQVRRLVGKPPATPSGYFRSGNKCIGVRGNISRKGSKVILGKCRKGRAAISQKWRMRSNGHIVNRKSGMCMDIAGANRSRGAKVIQWKCHRGLNQRWYLDAYNRIRSRLNNFCIRRSKNGILEMNHCTRKSPRFRISESTRVRSKPLRTSSKVGGVSGRVLTATKGKGLGRTFIRLMRGRKVFLRARTSRRGFFKITARSGMYTMVVYRRGFISARIPIFIKSGRFPIRRVYLSPTLPKGQLRFVLSWGARGSDLDLQSTTPSHCRLSYAQRKCDRRTFVLNKDISKPFGVETATLKKLKKGTYTFEVMTHRNKRMAVSEAVLTVYGARRRPLVFRIGKAGFVRKHVWKVMKMTVGKRGKLSFKACKNDKCFR